VSAIPFNYTTIHNCERDEHDDDDVDDDDAVTCMNYTIYQYVNTGSPRYEFIEINCASSDGQSVDCCSGYGELPLY